MQGHENSEESVLGYAKDPALTSVDSIDCALGHSDFGLPQAVQAYLRMGVSACDITRYPSQALNHKLIEELNGYHSVRSLTPENSFFGFGINHLFERIFSKLFDQHRLLAAGPFFVHAAKHVLANGGKYLSIHRDLETHKFPMAEAVQWIREHAHQRALFYLDNPNNPLGTVLSLPEVSELAHACEESQIAFIVDEAYGDFLPPDQSAISLIPEFSRLIVAKGFSKFFGMSGMRLGYLACGKFFELPLGKCAQPYEPATLSLKIASLCLHDEAYAFRVRRTIKSHKSVLMKASQDRGLLILPTHLETNMMSLWAPHVQLHLSLAEAGIDTIAGSSFGGTHRLFSDSMVRIRVPESEEKLNQVCSRIRALSFRETHR